MEPSQAGGGGVARSRHATGEPPTALSADRDPATSAFSRRVREFVERCRRKLIELSMRNRLLNYKFSARTGSVEILGEHPVAVWSRVVVEKKAMTLRGTVGGGAPTLLLTAGEEPLVPEPDADDAPTGPIEDSDAFAESIDEATAATHRDSFLDTRLEPKALSTRLLRISETARTSREEQGVETLFLALGFLRSYDDEASDEEHYAPLLLVPVALEREGSDRWRVRLRDDDPLVNPALVEYVRERHGIALPPLPDSIDEFQPLEWFQSVGRLISKKERWRLSGHCIVGIFSFQKFVMHEDLKKNVDVIAGHRLVGQLATRTAGSAATLRLPADVEGLNLDDACAVERTPQVVSADSSQLRALAAVARGYDLVIEGPPGTGKSQTIANLIAGAIAAGKSVLFVAEKQAALKVVHDRLRACGLGDFCFELHASKASKGAVIRELKRALDATLVREQIPEFDAKRLAAVRDELTAYAKALHEVVLPLGRSAFGVIGELVRLAGAPETRLALRTQDVSGDELSAALRAVEGLRDAAKRLGDPAKHPWRDSQGDVDYRAREAIESSLDALLLTVPKASEALSAAGDWGIPGDLSLAGGSAIAALAEAVARTPGVEAAVAADDSWITPEAQAEATGLISKGRAVSAALLRARAQFVTESAPAERINDATVVEALNHRRLRWLRPRWRRARTALRAASRPEAWRGARAAAIEVRAAVEAASAHDALNGDPRGPQRFGERWRGGDSDWNDLDRLAAWAPGFRAAVGAARADRRVLDRVGRAGGDDAGLRRLVTAFEAARSPWRAICAAAGWPQGYLEDRPLAELADRVRDLDGARTGWREWTDFRRRRQEVEAGIAAPLLSEADGGRLAWEALPPAFGRRFFERWLGARVDASAALRHFLGEPHVAKVEEFRDLDRSILDYHRRAIAAQLRVRAQELSQDPALQADWTFLRGQTARQKGHRPLRELLHEAGGAIRAIKPCFLMSPMTVAQSLDPRRHEFDLVVFDEASQLTPEDALGAIARGKQVVIVGDPKQLPPTNFFAVQSGQMAAPPAGGPGFQDLDSVLELALASGLHGTDLRWHYRSRHESLITYSNRSFYSSRLFTFPSADTDSSVRGIRFDLLEDGLYEGEGVNRAEARRVADTIVACSREHPTLSVGVGTFSLAQQLAVQDELERLRREDPALEEFLSLDRPEPLFVKNLESIQGDERDIIILSITYGRTADGGVRLHFGPISGENGWRRLNVLTSRARHRMIVISSMRADDIDLSRAQAEGARHLKSFLRYAETGVLDTGASVDPAAHAESPLEAEIASALSRAGVLVQPQVGVSRYRIDIGVKDPDAPGRFVCGIECDGVAYHASECARDRDRLRDEHLADLGWDIHRVWSLDWWHDRKGQTERLLRLIERSRAAHRERASQPLRGANAAVKATSEPKADAAPSPVESPSSPAAPDIASRAVEFVPYRFAAPRARRSGILAATPESVADVMEEVLRAEGPLHEKDLRVRTLTTFGHEREGSRLTAALDGGRAVLGRRAGVERVGEEWRIGSDAVRPRSRTGTKIPADRITRWEYAAAVVAALRARSALSEADLVAAVRVGFGFGAATAPLRAGVHDALEMLRTSGRAGVSSAGYGLISTVGPDGGQKDDAR